MIPLFDSVSNRYRELEQSIHDDEMIRWQAEQNDAYIRNDEYSESLER